MEKKSSAFKGKMLPLSLLSATCGMYNILYLCVIFYVPFQAAFGYTNEQMGGLLAAYSLIGTPLLFFGGMLSDLVNPKLLLSVSSMVAGLCGFMLLTFPSYAIAAVIFAVLALPISMHWGAYTKCVAMLGTSDEQGRLFGITNTIDGILTSVLTLGLTAILGNSIGSKAGFSVVIAVMSGVYFLTGVGLIFFFDYKKYAAINPQAVSKKGEKFTLKSIVDCLKEPITWIAAIMVMSSYMASSCLTYLSPYLSSVYVLPVALASAFGIITRYGVKVIASPLGGTLRDKNLGGSTPKLVWVATAGMAIFTAVLMAIPKSNAWVIPAVLTGLLVIFCFRLNNSSESTVYYGLKRTPMHLLGTVIGLACVIGYSSDLWLPRIIGNLLDTQGNSGYTYVFAIMIGAMLLNSAAGFVMYRMAKREKAASA